MAALPFHLPRGFGSPIFSEDPGSHVRSWHGHRPFDNLPQFGWLQLVLATVSLLVSALVLIAENRQSDMDRARLDITLQYALLNEQKLAKAIELLEGLRRDDPLLESRHDPAAAEMAKPTDVREVVEGLERAKEQALRERGLPPL